ncbi:hypothetical protein IEQ34_026616 [Dendrobium chrysotoxum]|uniref:Alpha-soluble NSF attachment protein n=1 Tax=Dendrobium chrysotoxum TaxID=161865 RepID=A0AAV7FL41_DENCH|nr:hypothetical protein IEQ34_026616 [Dendrobium chrysotoxum]
MADQTARGEEFEKKAEKKLAGWGLFGSKYEDAADLYEKAANCFKLGKNYLSCGLLANSSRSGRITCELKYFLSNWYQSKSWDRWRADFGKFLQQIFGRKGGKLLFFDFKNQIS